MADYVEDAEGPAVGIDLGTTYSCVAVYNNGHPKVIANDHGDRITPSCVSFSDGGLLVGNEARNRLTMQPTNTVYESKRLIGRTFDDPVIAKDIRRYPFDVVNDSGKPKFNVRHQGEAKTYYPEEISAMVLEKMKSVAESYLKKPVTKAVITVPAYFNETQRKATKDAARIAGLEVLRIINEPTAAAMAYGVNRQPGGDAERHVLVFDLGGGTFDVSVLVLDEGVFRVLATGGDTHLGGTDFDNRLVDKIINFFNKKQAVSEHATTNTMKREYHRLRNACEQAKCELSEFDFAKVQVEYFHNGQDLSYHLERSEFEALNQDLFDELMEHVKTTLADANLSTDDIDDVLLVGGSSRIPKIRERLQQLFHGKPLNAEINPDEAVACGAAIHAAILDGDESEELEDVMLQDITPLSLGINLKGDVTLPVVKRNSLVPCRYTKTVTTSEDDQTRIDMDVYQGERTHSRENHFLGEFHLDGIQPAPRSVPRIDVTFCIDADNCIEVTARDRFTLLEHTVKIEPNKAISSNEEISRLVQEATQHHQEDRAERERVTVRSALETRSHWVRHLTTTHSQTLQLSQQHLTIVNKVAQDITTWLYHNYENPTEEYKVQLHRLQKACESVGIPAECLVPGNVPGQTKPWSRPNQASWVDPAEDEAVPEVD